MSTNELSFKQFSELVSLGIGLGKFSISRVNDMCKCTEPLGLYSSEHDELFKFSKNTASNDLVSYTNEEQQYILCREPMIIYSLDGLSATEVSVVFEHANHLDTFKNYKVDISDYVYHEGRESFKFNISKEEDNISIDVYFCSYMTTTFIFIKSLYEPMIRKLGAYVGGSYVAFHGNKMTEYVCTRNAQEKCTKITEYEKPFVGTVKDLIARQHTLCFIREEIED